MGSGYVNPQGGTGLGNTFTNPLPNLTGSSSCGQADATNVHDYTEVVLTLHAPSNVQSFSFEFQFFSGEYPELRLHPIQRRISRHRAVVEELPDADEHLLRHADAPNHRQLGFFTVCTNDTTKPQTQHCMHPPSDNDGTGYEMSGLSLPLPGLPPPIPGGSTGWLSTTAPIQPGEDLTLRFVIFDEGDGALDSAVLLDNFKWGAATVMGPSTGPIGYKVIKRRKPAPAMMCLSPDART